MPSRRPRNTPNCLNGMCRLWRQCSRNGWNPPISTSASEAPGYLLSISSNSCTKPLAPLTYLKDTITVDYMEYTTTWRINGKTSEPTSVKVNNTYGTKRVNAYQIFEDCLNLQSTTVRDPVPYVDKNGKDQVRYVVNANETMIARAKQNQIKEAFASWLFKDKDRADILLKLYNEKFNTIRPRVYDGSHLVFSGMSEEMELRPHQKNFAARVIYSGTGLAGHVVGAGKTAAMLAASMYLKNIGAIKKPVYVVPNHLTEQWAKEFYRFFPQANILVTTKRDFEARNRNRFVSKIAMGEYDVRHVRN